MSNDFYGAKALHVQDIGYWTESVQILISLTIKPRLGFFKLNSS